MKTIRPTFARLALGLALCLPFAAQALDEEPLSMVYEKQRPTNQNLPNVPQQQAATTAPAALDGCRVPVRGMDDIRPHKGSLGAVMFPFEEFAFSVPTTATSIRSGDGTMWLKGAVRSLRPLGLSVPNTAPGEGVDVALRAAQTWLGGMNMHSHVVLQASYPLAGGTRVVKRYHGFGSKINGFGANSEFMTTLNIGMEEALNRFAADMRRFCQDGAI